MVTATAVAEPAEAMGLLLDGAVVVAAACLCAAVWLRVLVLKATAVALALALLALTLSAVAPTVLAVVPAFPAVADLVAACLLRTVAVGTTGRACLLVATAGLQACDCAESRLPALLLLACAVTGVMLCATVLTSPLLRSLLLICSLVGVPAFGIMLRSAPPLLLLVGTVSGVITAGNGCMTALPNLLTPGWAVDATSLALPKELCTVASMGVPSARLAAALGTRRTALGLKNVCEGRTVFGADGLRGEGFRAEAWRGKRLDGDLTP